MTRYTFAHYAVAMELNFAEITRAILVHFDLSEGQLAKKVGVSQPTIHRIKTGEIKQPTFQVGSQLVSLYDQIPLSAA